MLAKDLINIDFTPLEPGSTVSSALAKMDAWQSSSMPVVEPNTKKNVGHIRLEDIAVNIDGQKPISDIEFRNPIYTFETQHVFEIARQMLQYEVRLISVVDNSEQFLGIIEKKEVLEALSTMLNISAAGSTITVQLNRSDFTLTELVHLIETEGAKILGLTVEQQKETESLIQISLRITHQDTSAVISTLQRHGYTTTSENRNDLLQVDLTSRADELLRYLDV